MILNFYLRKHRHKGEMRSQERRNLARVRVLLKKRGVPSPEKLDYHEAIQLLAKLIAEECAGHCMRKAGTGHREAGIAGDTRSEPFSEHTPLSTDKPDMKLEHGNARAK